MEGTQFSPREAAVAPSESHLLSGMGLFLTWEQVSGHIRGGPLQGGHRHHLLPPLLWPFLLSSLPTMASPMAPSPYLRGLAFHTLAQQRAQDSSNLLCSDPRLPAPQGHPQAVSSQTPNHATQQASSPTSPNPQGLTLPVSLGTQKPLSLPATKPVDPTHCIFPSRWTGPTQAAFA